MATVIITAGSECCGAGLERGQAVYLCRILAATDIAKLCILLTGAAQLHSNSKYYKGLERRSMVRQFHELELEAASKII